MAWPAWVGPTRRAPAARSSRRSCAEPCVGAACSTFRPRTRPWCGPAGTWDAPVSSARPSRPSTSPCGTARPGSSGWRWRTSSGAPTEGVALYGSGGFTTYDDATARAQLERWTGEWAIPRVKIKIGESWGRCVERDLERVAFARRVIGDQVELFTDANGAYSRRQAVRVGRRLVDASSVTWFEEPVSSDDLEGLREVKDQLSLDVAAGEYGYDEVYFARMLRGESGRLPPDRRHPLRKVDVLAPQRRPGRRRAVEVSRTVPPICMRTSAPPCPTSVTWSTSTTISGWTHCSSTGCSIPPEACSPRAAASRDTAWCSRSPTRSAFGPRCTRTAPAGSGVYGPVWRLNDDQGERPWARSSKRPWAAKSPGTGS